jgi:hypothetical protein
MLEERTKKFIRFQFNKIKNEVAVGLSNLEAILLIFIQWNK